VGKIRRLAVLTSGGDAPGMNAAIRSVVRSALAHDIATFGVRRGYAGLVDGAYEEINNRQVGGILQFGGTMLSSMRHPQFRNEEIQLQAIAKLEEAGIDGLVVIGGNGSQQGSLALHRHGFPVVGVASTIDNDLAETETTIGVDTALNTAMSYVDKLKDTAISHHRAFIVEVMGRDSGYLALTTALATGAENVILPEFDVAPEDIVRDVEEAYGRDKSYYIVIVAEGARLKAQQITHYLNSDPGSFEARLSVLGHIQRGGSPTVRDRLLASQLANAAVEAIVAGRTGVVAGWMRGKPIEIPIEEAVRPCQKVTPDMIELLRVLSR
jgi:6-phosphofructokinase 1